MSTIALISEHASPLARAGSVDSGGQNIYVAHVARQLAAGGHRVDVFTRKDDPALPEALHWHPRVRVIHVPAGPARHVPKEQMLPYMDAFGRFLVAFSQRQPRRYDVVHANFFMSGAAGLQMSRALHIPLVITFHALGRVRRLHQREADGFPDERLTIEDELVREADRIVAECPEDYRDLVNLYGADPARIDIVPCGFDAAELSPVDRGRARKRLGWDPEAFSILQLGRMVPRKGVDNVIRAVANLRAHHGVPARLYVVGGDHHDPAQDASAELVRLRGIAEETGVTDAVQFVGRRERDQLPLFYGAADVFVTTPWYEPFGITPVEAMACARPVIGADVGGIRYTVEHGETGFHVPPREPELLARRLATLAHDPALAWRMGHAGLRRARQMFTWSRVANELTRVYAEARHPIAATAPARLPALAAVAAAVPSIAPARARLYLASVNGEAR